MACSANTIDSSGVAGNRRFASAIRSVLIRIPILSLARFPHSHWAGWVEPSRNPRANHSAFLTIPLPMNQTVGIFHHDDLVFFQHRQHDVLQFALPQFPFIELRFHRLARSDVRKPAHKKESVGIFDGKKWTQYLHPDFLVCRNRLGAEYLQELGPPAGLG